MAKVSEEQLKAGRELQSKRQQIQFEAGSLFLTAKEIAERQEELVSQFRESSLELKSFMSEISEEHGQGNLDLETGEFEVKEAEQS